ncbi:unnamed protein product [Brassicogethes aeneus]|uniref:DUF4806 domain-containing protein n=1 Tax=Brassicogethes aeneus TaxID=1431903 RepID=A0A9P0AV07_BRAAE|nr:unnamed protein product [Brassicogethes aeneus]
MSWKVVKFLNEDQVEAVPTSWITEDLEYCYFPRETENFKKAIRQCFPVKPFWKKYAVEVLSRKSYSKFAVASAKASKACCTSDLSEIEVLKKKRVPKRKYVSSSDSDNELLLKIPKFPTIKTNKVVEKETIKHTPLNKIIESAKESGCLTVELAKEAGCSSVELSKESSCSLVELSKESDCLLNELSKESDCSPDELPQESGCSPVELDFFDEISLADNLDNGEKENEPLKCILKKVLINNKMINTIFNAVQRIEERQKILITEFKKNQKQLPSTDSVDNFEFKEKFPLKNEVELEEMEIILKNSEIKNKMVLFFSKQGGIDFKECTRRCLKLCLTENLANTFSFMGQKNKKKFSSLSICEVVLDAVQEFDPTCTKKQIELHIAYWLTKSKERLKQIRV